MEKPCKTCTQVSNPEECTRLTCPVWREWFTWAWDKARLAALLKLLGSKEDTDK